MLKARIAFVLLLLPCLVLADISGSTVELETPFSGEAAIGDLVPFRFKLTNASPDLNWIANVAFAFPTCCSVVIMRFDDSESGNDWAFEFEGVGSNTASYLDADGAWGEIPGNGDYGWFEVTVRVGEDCEEQIDAIAWSLEADMWGAPPHELIGAIPIEFVYVPVQETSISAVKQSYR